MAPYWLQIGSKVQEEGSRDIVFTSFSDISRIKPRRDMCLRIVDVVSQLGLEGTSPGIVTHFFYLSGNPTTTVFFLEDDVQLQMYVGILIASTRSKAVTLDVSWCYYGDSLPIFRRQIGCPPRDQDSILRCASLISPFLSI